MPQLDYSTYPSQIFWLLLSVSFLFSFMKRVFVPRIIAILETREKRISADVEKTKEIKLSAKQAISNYSDRIEENKMKARKRREEMVEEFENIKQERLIKLNKIFFRKRLALEKEQIFAIEIRQKFVDILLRE